MKLRLSVSLLVAGFAIAVPVAAHHSASLFAPDADWVSGAVIAYRPTFPHATIVIDSQLPGGEVERWTIEGSGPGRLPSVGFRLESGDMISVCGFPLRESARPRDAAADPYGQSDRFVHGHVLKMPDGRLERFGPYGKMDLCVRAEHSTDMWVDFLNSRAMAGSAWCRPFNVDAEPTAPASMLAEIDRRMNAPCNPALKR